MRLNQEYFSRTDRECLSDEEKEGLRLDYLARQIRHRRDREEHQDRRHDNAQPKAR
jgi:hypothetical protein